MHRYHLAGPRSIKYHFVTKIRHVDCAVCCQLFRFQLRQAKCGYLVWIPKMRNHQLFLRERQEARFAHIQGNWRSSKAMKVFICGQAAISVDRRKLLTQCALCTQSDEGRSWSIRQVLQNTDQSFKICKSRSICKFATPTRASTIGNSPSLKTLQVTAHSSQFYVGLEIQVGWHSTIPSC